MNSFNHYAYGAVGDWLYRVVLGIEADEKEPGYRHVIVSPQTGDAFTYAQGSFKSVYGEIAVRWEKADGVTKLQVRVPVNTRATIVLEKGAREVKVQELVFAEADGQYRAECGSGEWTVEYKVG